MKLELKHLAPYLPYGLQFGLTRVKHTFECIGLTLHEDGIMAHHIKGSSNVSLDHYFKPILRPLSSFDDFDCHFAAHDDDWSEISDAIGDDNLNYIRHDLFMGLVEYHFDVFGLIDAGLAISIEALNKGAKS